MILRHSLGRCFLDKNSYIWRRFYECACHHEGVMMGYVYEDDNRFQCIDLAFVKVSNKHDTTNRLSLRERLRWCLHILLKGQPWLDMITMQKEVAASLGKDLIKFSKGKLK